MSQQFTLLRVVTGAKMALGNCSNIHKKQENLKNKIKRGEGKIYKSAHEKIRTSTFLRTQPPQGCASTNFATCAFIKLKKLSTTLNFFIVTGLGLEPRTLSLKGRCSTN